MKAWSDKLRSIEPYVPGIQPEDTDIIKLNTNENPYPPSPEVEKVLKTFDYTTLRLYPSIECKPLKAEISRIYGVEENEIFLGNGSDEVLALMFNAYFNSDKPVIFPNITYSFYDVWCELYGIKYNEIPLDSNFKIVKEDYYRENGGVVITNPNAPTGIKLPLAEIEDIIIHNQDVIVIVDEAYIDFGGESAVELIKKYENVVVVQTLSKSRNLAGIRVGYAMANKELIEVAEAVKNSFNSYTINTLSQEVAVAAFKDDKYFEECTNKIIVTRKWTTDELAKLGFDTFDSSSNFLFTTHKDINAEELYKYLFENKIIIRYFNKPILSDYLRITIGTDDEMKALVCAIKKFVKR